MKEDPPVTSTSSSASSSTILVESSPDLLVDSPVIDSTTPTTATSTASSRDRKRSYSGSTSPSVDTTTTTGSPQDPIRNNVITTPMSSSSGLQSIPLPSKKKSQRPSWSCTECTRRKIRCDRIVPGCSACRRRNAVDQCRLEDDILAFPAVPVEQVIPISHSSNSRLADPYDARPAQDHIITGHFSHIITSKLNDISTTPVAVPPRIQPTPNLLGSTRSNSSSPIPTPIASSDITPEPTSTSLSTTRSILQGDDAPERDTVVEHNSGDRYRVDLREVVKNLRAQVDQLELVVDGMNTSASCRRMPTSVGITLQPLAAPVSTITCSSPAKSRPLESKESSTASPEPPDANGELEAAETLEFLAMGRDRKEQHLSRAELRRPASEGDDDPGSIIGDVSSRTLMPCSGADDPTSRSSAMALTSTPALIPRSTRLSSSTEPAFPSAIALLDEARSRLVVRWAMNNMLAHNGLLHPPNFLSECIEYEAWPPQDQRRLVNAAWLALYYAVLCGALQQMTRAESIQIGLSSEEYQTLPRSYFNTCYQALGRADFLSKHSRFSVQAICIITTAGYEAGQSDLINTLLGCAIRIAQHLQFHRLGSDQDWIQKQLRKGVSLKSEEGIRLTINREICKRLWCTLMTDDWFTCTVRHSYAVQPHHSNTPLPLNITDEALNRGEDSSRHLVTSSSGRSADLAMDRDLPTSASKLLVMHSLADQLRYLFDEVMKAEESCQSLTDRIEDGIDRVMLGAPSWLQPGWQPVPGAPSWVAELRQHWFISCEHKKLVLHRLCPGRRSRGVFKDPSHPYVRQAVVKAARKILSQFTEGDKWPRNWTISYHTIVACTTLLLDLLHSIPSPSSKPTPFSNSDEMEYTTKHQEILLALNALRSLRQESIIISRGIKVIETMLLEEEEMKMKQGESMDSKAGTQNETSPGGGLDSKGSMSGEVEGGKKKGKGRSTRASSSVIPESASCRITSSAKPRVIRRIRNQGDRTQDALENPSKKKIKLTEPGTKGPDPLGVLPPGANPLQTLHGLVLNSTTGKELGTTSALLETLTSPAAIITSPSPALHSFTSTTDGFSSISKDLKAPDQMNAIVSPAISLRQLDPPSGVTLTLSSESTSSSFTTEQYPPFFSRGNTGIARMTIDSLGLDDHYIEGHGGDDEEEDGDDGIGLIPTLESILFDGLSNHDIGRDWSLFDSGYS